MESAASDRELVARYAREGSEPAFRALVARHVNLVFAAAFRQAGDAGVAEEVAQNVFVALARKAPRLAGHETLAGWLHRTAILEAKARLRADLRRQRRELAAAALDALHREGRSAAEDLTPLLDEGLLHLREGDRLALVLRFLEERSLREVGALLGVDEDAARKRVSRALDRLAEFFRVRGFAVSPAAGSALLSGAVQAAPAGLAASAASAGLAAGGAAGGFPLLLLQLMSLSKTQTAFVCALLAAVPLGWQWQARGDVRRTHAALAAQFDQQGSALMDAENEAGRLRALRLRLQAESFQASNRLAQLEAQRSVAPAAAAEHRWDDASPVMRVPKALLARLPLSGVANRRGQLSEQIQAALQFTPPESAAVQAALYRFLNAYDSALVHALRPVGPEPPDLQGNPPEKVRVFEIAGLQDTVAELRDGLFAELGRVLDAERLEVFIRSLYGWMPMGDGRGWIGSEIAVLAEDHRLRFYLLEDGALRLGYGLSTAQGSLTSVMPLDELPPVLVPYLQDWIDHLAAEHAAAQAQSALPDSGQP